MKTKLIYIMLFIVAASSVTIISCKKQDTVITNEQDINFFKRDELLKDAFSKLNGTLTDETLLNKVITEFKDYDKTKHISQDIITKFGKPKWDISIVLKNTNGFKTIFTPIANDKNEVTALAMFYQNSINGFNYKIVDRKTPQIKLPVYGDKEGKIFTKATLLGLFDVSDKNLSSFYKTGINAQIQTNSVTTNSYSISWVCWRYEWSYTLPDGTPGVGVSSTQCTYSIEYDPQTYLTPIGEGNFGGGGNVTPEIIDPCQKEFETFETLLSDKSSISSEKVSEEVIDIETFKKYKKIKWTCLKNVSWILSSKEIGIVELVSGNWRWVSLTHDDIALTGVPVGGTVTPNKGTGTPNFVEGNDNIKYASMDLDFDVTYKPNSFNCNGTSIQIPPYSLNYVTHSQLYNAAP